MEIPFQIILASLLSMIIISSLIYSLAIFRENESRNNVFNSFTNFKNKLENLCFSFPFTQEYEKIVVNENVIAIFAYYTDITKINDFEEIKDKVIEGNFICLSYKNYRIKCEKLSCNITMKSYYFEEKSTLIDYLLKSFYGIKEFSISYKLTREANKINIQ